MVRIGVLRSVRKNKAGMIRRSRGWIAVGAVAMLFVGALPTGFVSASHQAISIEAKPLVDYPGVVSATDRGAWMGGTFHVLPTGPLFPYHHYDPSDGSWTHVQVNTFPDAWRAQSGFGTLSGWAYAFGGFAFDELAGCEFHGPCERSERYDVLERRWDRIADMPTARYDAAVAVLGGRLYVVGGGGSEAAHVAVEAYDPHTNKWSVRAPLPEPVSKPSAVAAVNGRLYVVGGDGPSAARTTMIYNPLLDLWTRGADHPVNAQTAAAGMCGDRLVVFGARSDTGVDTAIRTYEPLLQSWEIVGELTSGVANGVWVPGGGLTAGNLTIAAQSYRDGPVSQDTVDALHCSAATTNPWDTQPDLYLDPWNIFPEPELVRPGDTVDLLTFVFNRGSVASEETEFQFRDESDPEDIKVIGTVPVPPIPPGEWAEVAWPAWTIPEDPLPAVLALLVDHTRAVTEFNEVNNVETVKFYPPPPDMCLCDLWWDPVDAGPGEAARVAARVTNAGAMNGTFPNTVSIRVGSDFLNETQMEIPPFAAGESAVVHSAEVIIPGPFTEVTASVNVHEGGDEAQQNNLMEKVLEAALADLTVAALETSPQEPVAGVGMTLTVAVANTGRHDAAAFQVLLEGSDGWSEEHLVDGLVAGDAQTLTTNGWVPAAPGAHTIRVTVDAHGDVDESNETNNALTRPVDVLPALADLVVDEIITTPTSPTPGAHVTTKAVVRNVGNVASDAGVVSITRDGSGLGDEPVPSLAVGATVTVTASQTWVATPGGHNLRAAVDPANLIPETEEGNNVLETTVQVAAGPS